MTNHSDTSPRIYVACLAAYNNGYLHGEWIDADQDAGAIRDEIAAMLARSPIEGVEEYAIHDYEGFEKRQGEAYCESRGYQLVETFVEPGAAAGVGASASFTAS